MREKSQTDDYHRPHHDHLQWPMFEINVYRRPPRTPPPNIRSFFNYIIMLDNIVSSS